MRLKKLFISLILLIFIFLKPCLPEESQAISKYDTSEHEEEIYLSPESLDRINAVVHKTGWNEKLLDLYTHYLLNFKIDISKEEKNIDDFPGNFQKDYLNALLLKREIKFSLMYQLLLSSLKNQPDYYPFYNELVFSASASEKIQDLTLNIEESDLPEKFKNYTLSLIKSTQGKYQESFDLIHPVYQEDSLNKNIAFHYSYLLRYLGEYEKALAILNSAEKFNKNDSIFLSNIYLAEGSLYFILGKYNQAGNLYKKGYNFSKKNNDRRNEAKALVNLGIIESINNNFNEAKDNFYSAAAIAEEVNDIELKAFALSESGVLSTYINNLIEAKNKYLEGYNLFKITGNRLRLSYLSENIGKIYFSIFDFKSALHFFNEGLSFAGDNKRATAVNLMGIADVYANLANYTKALEYYKKAKEISDDLNEASLKAEINSGLGTLNFNLERYSSALDYYNNAIELSKKAADPFIEGDLSYRHGLTYFRADSIEKAKECFKTAIQIAENCSDFVTEGFSNRDLAKAYLEDGNIKMAVEFLQEAEKIAEGTGWNYLSARNKLLRGEIYLKLNNFNEAKNNLSDCIKIAGELNDFNIQIEAYYFLAQLFEKNNLNEAAESYYQSSVHLIEDVSHPLFSERDVQISYYSLMMDVYNSFTEFYLKSGKYKEAFEIMDKSRSRNLMQNLNNLKLQVLLNDDAILDKIYEYEWMIHSGIYSQEEVNSLRDEYNKLKANLIKSNPELDNYLNFRKTLNIEEIQNNLGEKENILSLHSSETGSYLFLIKKNDFRTFKLNLTVSDINNLKKEISPYYNDKESGALFNHDLFSFNAKASYKFYKEILEPALSTLSDDEKIIFSPSTELILFPLEFLVTKFEEDESSYNYSDKTYLIYKFNISYTPSAAIYIEQKNNNLSNNNRVLLVGNPSIDRNYGTYSERRSLLEDMPGSPRNLSLLPLKYSGEEIAQIGSIINAYKILLENDATETNFKLNAEQSKIIHLSTHSFLYNKQPLIFFSNSGDKNNDGFLEAGEIVQLKLNSDLVVLSSCNSGLGRIDESEGIIGMTKAFYEAGAKSIIVSLWEVNDKFTSKFMILFYKKLSEGYNKTEALREAKVEFIKNVSANPYYWSAFVLSGNIDEITLKEKRKYQPYLVGIFIVIVFSFLIIYIKRRKN